MNLKVVFFSALMSLSLIVSAQLSPITFGPLAGFNQTTLSTNLDDYKESAKAGLQGGAFVRLTIKKLIIQPEVFIGAKRGELDFTYSPLNGTGQKFEATQDISLTALDVPLMVGYQLVDIPLFKLRANAGPVASFVLNKDVSISKNEGINANVPQTSLIDLSEDASWSIQAGLGVDVWKFTLDARYNFGISYIDSANTLRNNLFSINLGFKLL